MRKPIIAGNWKMNKTIKEGLEFIEAVKGKTEGDAEVLICAPFTLLKDLKEATKGTNIKIGAQNMHFEESGAFTGEVAPANLVELGIDYVIIGHSERREYYNETDETCNKKVLKAIEVGINPILCCGETLEERESNSTMDKVKGQIVKGLKDVKAEDLEKVVIAYEPIWAIGTGKTATAEQANEVIAYIRNVVRDLYADLADKVRIQYGGSVKPANVAEIMGQTDIDGALVGGASLKADDYLGLLKF
ncbi:MULTISPECIES: triose-phosphate isomerase [Peptostreptococcus]|uniref:Triosephosphate isomerase n=1 Tax=Peptostreptococcus anaerobius TaxID=1261 RepID=A0A135YXI8_9FIRM|nr:MULTISPECIES: triose-phosphate isomerase [Peptostreptococcus]EKX91034.1 triose-phosphate isomerase [Peptostreptococcus anaerobius VPI 4330 = DSM 2949]KXB70178.1 triose-phosphate isomerase [Peptostreptococcus anaerobius]KXI14099.1 triose-phosphate isomerase [Peptostreptococcus anaerobius]MBS5595540.1 triose-phosphate isomerase [Peptostreptococcus sp.]MCB6982191.1 triose-phosphate isomerase [Peptostreptococcus anaerobius]